MLELERSLSPDVTIVFDSPLTKSFFDYAVGSNDPKLGIPDVEAALLSFVLRLLKLYAAGLSLKMPALKL